MNINNSNVNTNFNARLISRAYIKGNKNQKPISLYSLDASDSKIIKDFARNFNLKNLYPKEKSYLDFQPWENIILGGIYQIGERDVILAVQGKKPCGVMAFYEQDKQINLTHLAKWRANPSSNTKFVGKILMHHLFDVASKKDALNISLYPSYCEPRGKNCKPFYLDLGFRFSAGGSLNLFGVNYARKAAQLEYFFDYKKLKDQSYVDAKKSFNLTFNNSAFQRIKNFCNEIF